MKILSLALGASLLAAPAFATKPAQRPVKPSSTCTRGSQQILTCSLEKPTRASKNVSIKKCRSQLVASLSMPGMTDAPVEVQSYFVKAQVPPRPMPGAGMAYVGEGFRLSINWSVRPAPGGGHYGNLSAKAGGEKIETRMVCRRAK